MITLIKKDMYFCRKYILIALLFSLAAPILLVVDGDGLYQLLSFYVPMVVTGVVFGKMCYTDDSDDVRMFLRSLPYKRSKFIASKFIELFLINAISIIYVSVIQIILNKGINTTSTLKINILVGAFFIFYYSIYLFLYFKNNYYAAQNTMYIVLAVVFVCVFASNRNLLSNINMNWLFNNSVVAIILGIAIIIYTASMYIIIKGEK